MSRFSADGNDGMNTGESFGGMIRPEVTRRAYREFTSVQEPRARSLDVQNLTGNRDLHLARLAVLGLPDDLERILTLDLGLPCLVEGDSGYRLLRRLHHGSGDLLQGNQ